MNSKMSYAIGFTDLGHSSLKALDKNLRREVSKEILSLRDQPILGKSLMGLLRGLRSLRVRNRYRVVYRLDDECERVYIEFIGERRAGKDDDVYRLAQKLLKTLQG